MDYSQLAKDILENVGGEQNVNALVHCTTRLRFNLIKRERVNRSKIEGLSGVIQIMEMAGQFQIVVGPDVNELYREILKLTNLGDDDDVKERSTSKQPFFHLVIDVISSIFTPLLGAMAGVGMLKGLLIVSVSLDLLTEDDGTYQVLHAASDSLFYFLPILLAITSARKFKTDPYIAVVIAGALLYPDLMSMYDNGEDISFLGIPIFLTNYSSSVIPILMTVFVMSKIQPILHKWFHSSVKTFFTPLVLISTMVPLTLLVFGPFGTFVSKWLGTGYLFIYDSSSLFAGAIAGLSWQILVIFGLHWGLVPLAVNNLSQFGSDTFAAMVTPAIFGQAGAALGVWLKSKQKKVKVIAGPAAFAGLFGITEPAIYGVTLRYKKPFIFGCIAGGVGGAITGISGVSAASTAVPGITTLPVFFGQGFMLFLVAILVSIVVAVILTFLFGYKDEEISEEEPVVLQKELVNVSEDTLIASPLTGVIIPLEAVDDEVFASGAIGSGIAIIPTDGKIYSPVNGEVMSIFPSQHAIGFRSDSGIEILIHIGMNTVQLGGSHFHIHVNQGDQVKKGQLIGDFELMSIVEAGYKITTPIVITNYLDYLDVISGEQENIEVGERLLTVVT